MLPALGAFAPIIGSVFKTIEKSIPDKDLAEKLKAEVNLQLMKSGTEEMKASASIILQESKGSFLQANWRPCLMWLLLAIVFWNYILSPIILLFFKIKTDVELPSDVWTLLTVGLGGYTIGRSGESIARSLATRPIQSKDQEHG
jgi:hypothetical protein